MFPLESRPGSSSARASYGSNAAPTNPLVEMGSSAGKKPRPLAIPNSSNDHAAALDISKQSKPLFFKRRDLSRISLFNFEVSASFMTCVALTMTCLATIVSVLSTPSAVVPTRLALDTLVPAGNDAPCNKTGLLWNGLCAPTLNGWPDNNLRERPVTSPEYLQAEHKPKVINITTGRQLFVDSFLINALSTDVGIVFYNAEYATKVNPVIKATHPWEVSSSYAGGYSGFASPFSGGSWWNPQDARYYPPFDSLARPLDIVSGSVTRALCS